MCTQKKHSASADPNTQTHTFLTCSIPECKVDQFVVHFNAGCEVVKTLHTDSSTTKGEQETVNSVQRKHERVQETTPQQENSKDRQSERERDSHVVESTHGKHIDQRLDVHSRNVVDREPVFCVGDEKRRLSNSAVYRSSKTHKHTHTHTHINVEDQKKNKRAVKHMRGRLFVSTRFHT
jgi:hypothetical protein